MSGFLNEFGQKLADRWLALLVLPGLLWVGAVVTALVLQGHSALDVRYLQSWIESTAGVSAHVRTGVVVADVVGALLAASGAGIIATWLGGAADLFWNAPGRRFPGSVLVRLRDARFAPRLRGLRTMLVTEEPENTASAALGDAMSACARVSLVEPDRLTWIGDRFHAADVRVHHAYRLDLAAAWPRLWPLLSDGFRADFGTAQDSYISSARLVGWCVLYTVIGPIWWPALVIAAGAGIAGWVRARRSADILAALTESAVDLRGAALARELGFDCEGALTPEIGKQITDVLRKDGVLVALAVNRSPTRQK